MGMFDDVKCEAPLPDGYKGEWFQTKDLGCELVKYIITAGGRLVQASSPWYEDEDNKPINKPSEGWVRDLNYHGYLVFYTNERDPNDKSKGWIWHEYQAKFTDGKLVEITKLENRR